ncbi:MAG: hypothetical protein P8Y64_13565 [Gammaproteobacteria bacterium]|jgi:hypothetical protein
MKRLASTLALTLILSIAATLPVLADNATQQKYPDVVGVKVQASGADTFDFAATISSPYDTPQRYADAFRVMNADGHVYGVRKLLHDHGYEQPFTRSLYGVKIPAGVQTVVVQGRDQKYGYGGKTRTVKLPGR